MGSGFHAARRTSAHMARIEMHAPEVPGEAWRCPECGTARPGDAFYCDHGEDPGPLSKDMTPRLVKGGGE